MTASPEANQEPAAQATPSWLVDAQNKSWEPEILISGLTLTSLFILSDHLYNFFAMLIQEFAVLPAFAHILYAISLIMLTGLQAVLILHLVLRGLWTALVGLSYVYPGGIRRERLGKADQELPFRRPAELVIKIETVCSLLFAFSFSSCAFFFTTLLLYFLAVGIFLLKLDAATTRMLILAFFLVVTIVLPIAAKRWSTLFRTGVLRTIFMTFLTNLGRARVIATFSGYFLLILLLSLPDILAFSFRNHSASEVKTEAGLVVYNNDRYEQLRDPAQRIDKATISSSTVHGEPLTLSLAYYQEDLSSLAGVAAEEGLQDKLLRGEQQRLTLADLYEITIDDVPVSTHSWHLVRREPTHQQLVVTTVPLTGIGPGDHRLQVHKYRWRRSKKELQRTAGWAVIPFQLVAAATAGSGHPGPTGEGSPQVPRYGS